METTSERKTQIMEKRKLMGDKRMSMGMKSFYASVIGSIFRMSDEQRSSFAAMFRRHKADAQYVDTTYVDNPVEEYEPIYQTVFDDDRDPVLEPTFSKHRIPLYVVWSATTIPSGSTPSSLSGRSNS
ncbi:uncharacterized protein LOC122621501 isoform X2 [Drosophila teissieri]|uniref:uncharacterized protein LOC122621501 isoform X2 n=1 Tax=Drosophila teissieri TaxID=7243 RepID=UPI001CBA30CA|nr:uncharacterized protein LOC122621501 isoform X2 [Drosophila teissieri]